MSLPSIVDQFTSSDPDCPSCQGGGIVCENHPHLPWDGIIQGGCGCGAGAPCPRCTPQQRFD